ncbi:MAG: major facilitator superfamily 1, partial [Actinomycetia bacterium]|nr:major facilitator superfamily 1 [Actinomycetes bacterium]
MLNIARTSLAVLTLLVGNALAASSPAHAAGPGRELTGLAGTVTGMATGAWLPGVHVEVLRITDPGDGGPLVATATTDRHGVYRLPGLAPGEYVVGFAKAGFVTEYTGRENDPWQAEEIVVPGTVNAQLTRAAGVRGTLTDQAGRPVPSAEVTAVPAFHDSLAAIVPGTVTKGRYTLGGILPGSYTVTFSVPGHPLQYVPGQLTESGAAHIPLQAGANTVSDVLVPLPVAAGPLAARGGAAG